MKITGGMGLMALMALAACGDSNGPDSTALVPGQYEISADLPGGTRRWSTIEITWITDTELYLRYLEPDFAYAEGNNPLQPAAGGARVFRFQRGAGSGDDAHSLEWRMRPQMGVHVCENFMLDGAGPYACNMTRTGPVEAAP